MRSFAALLQLPAELPQPQARLDPGAGGPAHARRRAGRCRSQVLAQLVQARALCAAQQITVSDRRWRKLAALLQVQAASRPGRDDAEQTVSPWDLWVLPYVLAARPAQCPMLRDGFLAGVGQAVPVDVLWLVRATEAFEKQLEIETSAPASSDDDGAGKLALARAIARPGAQDADQGLGSHRVRPGAQALQRPARGGARSAGAGGDRPRGCGAAERAGHG
jgi:MoxR-like ATPase